MENRNMIGWAGAPVGLDRRASGARRRAVLPGLADRCPVPAVRDAALSGRRAQPDLKRLSFAGGAGLVLAFVATFALYVAAFAYAEGEKSLISGTDPTAAMSLRQ
jgi:hypothetical protein